MGIFSFLKPKKTMSDEQFGEGLACIVMKFASDDCSSDFVKRYISLLEKNRFMFSYAILNTVLAITVINITAKYTHNRKRVILDNMLTAFKQMLSSISGSENINIKQFIPSADEREYIRSQWGDGDFDTNIRSLLDVLYNRKMEEYNEGLVLGFSKDKGTSLGPYSNVIMAFGDHVHGDNTAKDIQYIMQMSQMLSANLDGFLGACEEHP